MAPREVHILGCCFFTVSQLPLPHSWPRILYSSLRYEIMGSPLWRGWATNQREKHYGGMRYANTCGRRSTISSYETGYSPHFAPLLSKLEG